jgi:hypothetical protein
MPIQMMPRSGYIEMIIINIYVEAITRFLQYQIYAQEEPHLLHLKVTDIMFLRDLTLLNYS